MIVMRKFHIYLFIALLFSCNDEQDAGPADRNTFVKYFGGEHSDVAQMVKTTDDGGFILLGNTTIPSGTSFINKIKLIKTDKNGNTDWEKIYPSFDETAYSVKGNSIYVTNDGGYIITGERINNADPSVTGLSLLKMSNTGKIISNYTSLPVSPSSIDTLFSGVDVIEDQSSGDIVVLGAGKVVSDNSNFMFWYRFDNTLAPIPDCSENLENDLSIIKSLHKDYVNENYIFGGVSVVNNALNMYAYFTSSDQCKQSFAIMNNSISITNAGKYYEPTQIIPFGDNIAAVGTTNDKASGNDTDLFIAVGLSGGAINSYNFNVSENSEEVGKSITASHDGGFVAVGTSISTNNLGSDIFVVKSSSKGEQGWQKTLGDKYNEEAVHVEQTSDGGYIIAGNIDFGNVDTMLLIKINKDGELE